MMDWKNVTFWAWMVAGPVVMTGHIYRIQYLITWIMLMLALWERIGT